MVSMLRRCKREKNTQTHSALEISHVRHILMSLQPIWPIVSGITTDSQC